MKHRTAPLLWTLILFMAGCATNLGPRSLPSVRMNYTESVAHSMEQQMLMNVVRLRHGRIPVFLQVSSIVTQYSLSTNVGVSATGNAVGPGGFVPPVGGGASTGVHVEERPTISYTPLQGEDFVRRLATPLSPAAVAQLVQAGWPWDAVLDCCVQQVNGLFAPASPWREEHTDFQRLGDALARLQTSHAVSVHTDAHGTPALVFAVPGTDEGKRDVALVRQLLGIDDETYRSPITSEAAPQAFTVHGRSMLATLYYVSQGVEGPARWRSPLGDDALLHVRASKRAPKNAYASVEFGEKTFYIDADDIESQGTFVLITYLFSLMAAPGGTGPVLTVGASG